MNDREKKFVCRTKEEAYALADEIIKLCGIEPVLMIGEENNLLAAELVARGLNVQTFDILQNNSLKDLEQVFATVICIGILEQIHTDHLEEFIQQLSRISTRNFIGKVISENGRAYWEKFFFEAGFRKHPLLLHYVGYESFEYESETFTLLFEKIPNKAIETYPLNVLLEERSLHMDMLRETGRRSDAHVARYSKALQFVRPNDVVLDVACGLGYGSAILWDGSLAKQVIGVDNSEYSVNYSNLNYKPNREGIHFIQEDAQLLSFLEPSSVDLVVSMETVEHLEDPEVFFKKIKNLLKPGGRVILSVPNEWVDEDGNDPNPYHLHVFNRESIVNLVKRYFMIEHVFGQVAGGGMKHTDSARSWFESKENEEAEWWIVVGMKNPVVEGSEYKETVLWSMEKNQTLPPIEAYDYKNQYTFPWIQHSLVSIGYRASSEELLHNIANEIMHKAIRNSADYGAALCVLGYNALSKRPIDDVESDHLIQQLEEYLSFNPNTPMEVRWSISCSYLLATMYLKNGKHLMALTTFKKCLEYDHLKYSATLSTKIINACLQIANLYAIQNDLTEARNWWTRTINETEKCMKVSISDWIGDQQEPLTFALKEASFVLDSASQAAYALWLTSDGYFKRPSSFQAIIDFSEMSQKKWFQNQASTFQAYAKTNEELNKWIGKLEESRKWTEEHIKNIESENAKWKENNQELKSWIDELEKSRDWLTEKVDLLEKSVQEKEAIILEQKSWNEELEAGKKWIEENVREKEAIILEQKKWNEELEKGKQWLESKVSELEQLLAKRN
ncbi:methyltransferase domain-containing protein [Paenibacillus oleatilyticus]|uniref:Methyltransferase domain-containing protein n=1 Tax=Paenibacillus oleatilyticus TaxID=2594886 RepID=A0ABV4V4X9_9BACL